VSKNEISGPIIPDGGDHFGVPFLVIVFQFRYQYIDIVIQD